MEDLPSASPFTAPHPAHFSISGCEKSLWPAAVLQLLFILGFFPLPNTPAPPTPRQPSLSAEPGRSIRKASAREEKCSPSTHLVSLGDALSRGPSAPAPPAPLPRRALTFGVRPEVLALPHAQLPGHRLGGPLPSWQRCADPSPLLRSSAAPCPPLQPSCILR